MGGGGALPSYHHARFCPPRTLRAVPRYFLPHILTLRAAIIPRKDWATFLHSICRHFNTYHHPTTTCYTLPPMVVVPSCATRTADSAQTAAAAWRRTDDWRTWRRNARRCNDRASAKRQGFSSPLPAPAIPPFTPLYILLCDEPSLPLPFTFCLCLPAACCHQPIVCTHGLHLHSAELVVGSRMAAIS